MATLHYRLTEWMTRLGPANPFVRVALRAASRGVRLRFSAGSIDLVRERKILRLAAHHFPYVPDVARHFDHYFDQVIPENRGTSLLVDYSAPRLHRYAATGLEFEFSSLAEEVATLEEYFRWYRPQPGDLVFDIGAYCGASAYHMAAMVGSSGKVYAFEPDPLNFALLQRNIERHRLTNVFPLQIAIADHTGEVDFFSEGALGSSISDYSGRAPAGERLRVPSLTFVDACRTYGTPAFIKLDIEGAEVAMLQAAAPFLRQHPIHFAIDTGHVVEGKLTAPAVEHIFRSSGYRVSSGAQSGFMTTLASASGVREHTIHTDVA